jgi:hypothetical protein
VVILGKSVIVQKDKKVRAIFAECGLELQLDDFKKIFKEKHPKDWANVNNVYQDHEKKQKPGKKRHPMPRPEQYLENTYNNYKKKLTEEKNKEDDE